MYKVFVNEKKLLISKSPESLEKVLQYESAATIEMAIDLLQNTSCSELNIYYDNLEKLWEDFNHAFQLIEAAGGILDNGNGEILFIKRLGKWDLPKGKIEKGESLEEAALREVEEETALQKLSLGDFINATYHIYIDKNGKNILKKTSWFAMEHLGNKAPKPQTEEGIIDVDWKNINQIKSVVFPMTFKNIQLILNEYWNKI